MSFVEVLNLTAVFNIYWYTICISHGTRAVRYEPRYVYMHTRCCREEEAKMLPWYIYPLVPAYRSPLFFASFGLILRARVDLPAKARVYPWLYLPARRLRVLHGIS